MTTSNYKVNGLKKAGQIISNSDVRKLNKEGKLSWVGGHRFIGDDSKMYFFKENEQGKALFMHIAGEKTSTFFVAKFKK